MLKVISCGGKDREGEKGGGIMISTTTTKLCLHHPEMSFTGNVRVEMLTMEMSTAGGEINTVITVYMPPQASVRSSMEEYNELPHNTVQGLRSLRHKMEKKIEREYIYLGTSTTL